MAWDPDKPDMDLATGTDFSDADAFFRDNFAWLELALIEYCNFPGSLDYIDEMGMPKARRYNLAGRDALTPIANMWVLRSDRRAIDIYASLSWHTYQTSIIGEFTLAAFDPASPPDGWLECNGQAISRATYALLFAAIGTTWGIGDGSTTFNLPDARSQVLVGMDDGDADYDAIAKSGGDSTHQLLPAELPAHQHLLATHSWNHSHQIDAGITSGGTPPPWRAPTIGLYGATSIPAGAGGDHVHVVDDSGETRDVAHNNKQPYLTLGYLICTGV
jgi:microcystin-dependent protein